MQRLVAHVCLAITTELWRTQPHCPKNILNFHIKTEPVTVGTDASSGFLEHMYDVYTVHEQKPDTLYCYIRSIYNRDRIVFFAEIQIIFGT